MRLALEGTRVLDMAWVGPGPFCATMLGDLGADIIKVHEPDPERRGGLVKYALPDAPGFPGIRNCRTIGLDLKGEEGRRIFHELATTADVVMESYRPGVVERLGVDYDTVREVNPRIVYASLSGYGQDGPYRDAVGHDINYISIGGLLGMTGASDGPPAVPGTLVADFAAGGMAAAIGIMAALMAREKTDRGQFVDVAITDGIVEMMSMYINPYLLYGMLDKRGETMFTVANAPKEWTSLQQTVADIKSLRPVLTAAGEIHTWVETPAEDVEVHIWEKRLPDRTVIIAVNRDETPSELSFAPKTLPRDCRVKVLFEDREVEVKEGLLTDSFEELAVHVYEWEA